MQYCLAMFDSGNYVFNLRRILEQKGYSFEVVATPCRIAKGGCGYCLKFPEEYFETVINEGRLNRMVVREIYRVTSLSSKNKYEKIY